MAAKKFIKKAIKKPGSLTAMAKRENGLNKDGTISRVWARKKVKDPNTTLKTKQKINLFLNVLDKPKKKKTRKATEKRKRNPVGPSQRQKIDKAVKLYKKFRDQEPEFIDEVEVPHIDVGMVIGKCDGVLYETVRSGVKEKYIHEFTGRSRPLLCATFDGKQIFLVGGRYNFGEEGIKDY